MKSSTSLKSKESPVVQGKSHEADIVLSIFRTIVNQQQELNNSGVLNAKDKAALENFYHNRIVPMAENWHETFSEMVILEMSQAFFQKLGTFNSNILDFGVTGIRNREVELITMINDDDEMTREQIYLAKAFTNQFFSKTGYRMNVLLFEKSEQYVIPNSFSQYQALTKSESVEKSR